MMDLPEFAHAESTEVHPSSAPCEARFPVAYSHGGFAQLRHALPNADVNPLAPIQVPDGFDAVSTTSYGDSSVVFLRS